MIVSKKNYKDIYCCGMNYTTNTHLLNCKEGYKAMNRIKINESDK